MLEFTPRADRRCVSTSARRLKRPSRRLVSISASQQAFTWTKSLAEWLTSEARRAERLNVLKCCIPPLLLESRGGGTHPRLPSRYDRGGPCRRREDAARRRSHRSGPRDHGPLPPRRQGAPAPARHPRGDVHRRRLRGRRPLATYGGTRRRAGQGGAQPEVRSPVPGCPARRLPLAPIRHHARGASPRRRQLRGLLLSGSRGRALSGRVAGQVRAAERLVGEVERGTARVRRAGR